MNPIAPFSNADDAAASSEPAPPPTFDVLPLSTEMRQTLAEIGYVHPTPVQRAVFEPATRGLDLVVQARTGTGKTAAFGLPIVESAVRRSDERVQVLALCPTRELALQVAAEIERLGKRREIVPLAIYGGAPMGRQIEALESGKHQVLVGTPGRVLDHLTRGTLDPSGLRLLVLDEADEMLSMGFERELTAILEHLPKDRQTLLFSATIPPDIDRIARERLRSPEFITLSGDHVGALEIEHFVYFVRGEKLDALVRIIEVENPESAIVFCNTRAETERVAEGLRRQGYDADWLNADLPQGDREKVMAKVREGRLRFLVATDVAARGIDVSHLTHVINHDFPDNAERYVHRTGRTGRAGRTGMAISLITPRDIGNLYLLRLTYKIRPIEKQVPSAGELKTRAEADLVQMLADAYATQTPHPDDLALARRLLTHEAAESILAGLLRDHLGARPDAAEQAAAARRSTKTPEPPRRTPGERPQRGTHVESQKTTRTEPQTSVQAEPQKILQAEPQKPTQRAPEREPRRDERREMRRDERRDRREKRRERPAVSVRVDERAGGEGPTELDLRRPDIESWAPPPEPGDDEPIFRWEEKPMPTTEIRPSSASEARAPERDVHDTTPPPAPERDDLADVFVNVGRRDGAHADDFQRALVERSDLPAERVVRIRVRDRHAFVSVRRDDLERAVRALDGATIAGKIARAEPSRSRSSGTSSPNEG
jgi:ATP-dependent RNA helicase DeaD